MIAEKYRNKIATWEGGGYDGCICEPNCGFIDGEGVWHPVISTGCGAIDDEDTLLDAIEEMENSDCENRTKGGSWRKYDSFQLWDLSQEGIDRIGLRTDFKARLLDKIAEVTHHGYSMVCSKCGKHFGSLDYSYSDIIGIMADSGFSRGCGGIATVCDDIWCDECRSEGECRYCNEISNCFTDSDHNNFREQFFADWLHICESCTHWFVHEMELRDIMDEYEERFDEALDEEAKNVIINELRDKVEPFARCYGNFKHHDFDFDDRLETKGENHE